MNFLKEAIKKSKNKILVKEIDLESLSGVNVLPKLSDSCKTNIHVRPVYLNLAGFYVSLIRFLYLLDNK